jgi:protein gp37
MARRLRAMGQPNYARGFRVSVHDRSLDLPLRWKKPQTVFVNSMSDLFHPAVPESFVHRVFDVMAEADHHVYQVLTKRSERLAELSARLPWPEHVWMGVSVENNDYVHRVDHLRSTAAGVKFLSLEPLLGPLADLDLWGIDWVIVGGESGPGARPMEREWVRAIRDRCLGANVPFFFKQWGGVNKKKAGRLLDGRTWSEMPSRAPRRAKSLRVAVAEA